MYKDTVTLFIRHKERGGIVWYPNVLRNVDLNIETETKTDSSGDSSSDSVKLHIRTRMKNDGIIMSGKRYFTRREWDELEDKTNCVTFKSGNDFDFIAVGEYSEEPIDDNAYTAGFYDYLNKRDGVYAIKSVAYFSVIPHFEVLAG